MLKMFCYNNGTKGGTLLAEALGIAKLKHNRSKWVPRDKDHVLNWGFAGVLPYRHIINRPNSVANAICKLRTFRILSRAGVSIPEFTDSLQEALGWLRTADIISRATTTGKGGEGIGVHPRGSNDLPRVPLYVKRVLKKAEYRIHVAFGEVIDKQQKKRRLDAPKGDGIVRNHDNGYVFVRNGIQVPKKVEEEAVKAVAALALDFGGVDVVYNQKADKAYVLEVNTAPGIEGTTVTKYKDAFAKYL